MLRLHQEGSVRVSTSCRISGFAEALCEFHVETHVETLLRLSQYATKIDVSLRASSILWDSDATRKGVQVSTCCKKCVFVQGFLHSTMLKLHQGCSQEGAVWVALAASPTPAVSWHGFLVGQLLCQSALYSAERGGTVFDYPLGTLPMGELFK